MRTPGTFGIYTDSGATPNDIQRQSEKLLLLELQLLASRAHGMDKEGSNVILRERGS